MDTHFSLPEQMAVAEVLNLISRGSLKIQNFDFFSRIESTPLQQITDPAEKCGQHEMYDSKTAYLRTSVSFYCRGEQVAEVTMEGSVTFRSTVGMIDVWRTTKVSAREYFWRNDPDESRTWHEYKPKYGLYRAIKSGTPEEEKGFETLIRETLS
ncbi:MAG: hypothetical protein Q8R29_03145 [bacterium]|nr:hypothetical protein [bacterium]